MWRRKTEIYDSGEIAQLLNLSERLDVVGWAGLMEPTSLFSDTEGEVEEVQSILESASHGHPWLTPPFPKRWIM